jgi:hypothetical protein
MAHGIVREIPQPLVNGRFVIDYDALERACDAAHQAAAVHIAVESAGLGRDRSGSGSIARIHAPSTACG